MTDIVLAPSTSIETTSATEAAIAPRRPYVEPKRLDVPASVVRELLIAAGLGESCAKATLVLQTSYSTNAGALSVERLVDQPEPWSPTAEAKGERAVSTERRHQCTSTTIVAPTASLATPAMSKIRTLTVFTVGHEH
jgi:hypothetical protein